MKTPNWWSREFWCEFYVESKGCWATQKVKLITVSIGMETKIKSKVTSTPSTVARNESGWNEKTFPLSLHTLQRQKGRKLWDAPQSPTCEGAHLANGMSCGICCYWFPSLGTLHTGDSAAPQNSLLNPQACQGQTENYPYGFAKSHNFASWLTHSWQSWIARRKLLKALVKALRVRGHH